MFGGHHTSDGDRQSNEDDKMKKLFIFIFFLGIFSLFVGSKEYRFRGEEPTRLVMAYEMSYKSSFYQPTYLGEEYYRKPPLINWLIIASSKIWNWNKFTGRFISIVASILTALLIYLFGKIYIFKEDLPSILSAVIFLSFIDVTFWYGFLIEIDMTLTFIAISLIFCMIVAFEKRSYLFFSGSGILTGFAFLLKGFPAFVFLGATYTALLIYHIFIKNFSAKLIYGFFLSVISSFIPITFWILNLSHPVEYISVLWSESFGRVNQSKDLLKFFYHLFYYPLLNIKQTLLVSAVFIIFAVFKKFRFEFKQNSMIFALIVIFLLNYIPYWISAGARGRYILPMLPIVAILLANFFYYSGKDRIIKILSGVIAFTFFVRVIAGLFYFPYETSKKDYYSKVSRKIFSDITQKGEIVSDCDVHKGLIFYLDVLTGKMITSERKNPNWRYYISCYKKVDGKLIGSYRIKSDIINLYEREK